MLAKRIEFHKTLMIVACSIHLILWIVTLLELMANGTQFVGETSFCSIAGHLNPDMYMLGNALLCAFYFCLMKRAVNHSSNITIFQILQNRLFYWLFAPILFFVFRYLANKNCEHHSFSLTQTFLYFLHLSIELSLMYMYLGWYYNELQSFSDAG